MPSKTRTGKAHPKGGGKSKTITYYPRRSGAWVAETGPHAGKTVAKRNMSQDRKRSSKTPLKRGYGHRSDTQK